MDWKFIDSCNFPERTMKRLRESYDNPKRPIRYGEAETEIVALIQALLHARDYDMPKSVKETINLGKRGYLCDGLFGTET